MKRFILLGILFVSTLSAWGKKKITVMIDPDGDAEYLGRLIDDSYERGVTLECARALKNSLEHRNSNVRVVLTRVPGEKVDRLQNASYANRLQADLYISLHFYQKKEGDTTVGIYYFCLNKTGDAWQKVQSDLSFVPYNQAHLKNFLFTKQLAKDLFSFCHEKHYSLFVVQKPLGIPFKSLLGVNAPALAFDISLKSKNEWKKLVVPLVETIEKGVALCRNV